MHKPLVFIQVLLLASALVSSGGYTCAPGFQKAHSWMGSAAIVSADSGVSAGCVDRGDGSALVGPASLQLHIPYHSPTYSGLSPDIRTAMPGIPFARAPPR